MRVDRLERLKAVLREVEEQQKPFNIGAWMAKTHPATQELVNGHNLGAFCGTACCAMGWAAFDPELRGQGLHMIVRTILPDFSDGPKSEWKAVSSLEDFDARFVETVRDPGSFIETTVAFDDAIGFQAAAEFFAIGVDEAIRLFSSRAYWTEERRGTPIRVTPAMVIERIDALLDAHRNKSLAGD
jgi:hypothetical protein